ncbi:MAG: endonuclease III domain-containing protein [Desulfuromonadales bacterium]|nr:endonuclease III domain-containing protein [Desulfuromonadales bacterium]MBN2790871.1 endonuclease III domain-containing protein [Desulfuromonadales bacterium]
MSQFITIYRQLFDHYGPRDWWPAETPFEVVIGAILTQNTNWNNVEKAISNLKAADSLTSGVISTLPREELEELIRPSGFFRQKAERLQLFSNYLADRYQNDLDRMLQRPLEELRQELLSMKGIGPETADSILLYAGRRPSFVVDAYTLRLFSRLGLLTGRENYDQIRQLFMSQLEQDVALYNEYHALIVIHCKDFCRKKPLCPDCPIRDICLYIKENS